MAADFAKPTRRDASVTQYVGAWLLATFYAYLPFYWLSFVVTTLFVVFPVFPFAAERARVCTTDRRPSASLLTAFVCAGGDDVPTSVTGVLLRNAAFFAFFALVILAAGISRSAVFRRTLRSVHFALLFFLAWHALHTLVTTLPVGVGAWSWSWRAAWLALFLFSCTEPFVNPLLGSPRRFWPALIDALPWSLVTNLYFHGLRVSYLDAHGRLCTSFQDDEADARGETASYLAAYHPHGVWPWALLIGVASRRLSFKTARQLASPSLVYSAALSARDTGIRFLTASSLLLLPAIGHWLAWCGAVHASSDATRAAKALGLSCFVVPGGLPEAVLANRNAPDSRARTYETFVAGRYGFLRVAMTLGMPVVPVFCYGESETYEQVQVARDRRVALSRTLGFPITAFWGRWGTQMPFPTEFHMAVGAPLRFERVEKPTIEQLKDAGRRYEAALADLFERTKANKGDRLIIL